MTNDNATTDPAVVHTPDGETYLLDECEIEYPTPSGTEALIDTMTSEGMGNDMMDLYRYIDEHQFDDIASKATDSHSESPVVTRPVSIQAVIEDLSWRDVLALLTRNDVQVQADITPWVISGIMFGTALERDYPSFTTADQGWVEKREAAGLSPEPDRDEISDTGEDDNDGN